MKRVASGDALFPVMISRELYEASPWDLLPDSLRPAEEIAKLSPADRVFGWVQTDRKKNGAIRDEKPRFGDFSALARLPARQGGGEDAIEEFAGDGLPLAVLAQPKPQQGRFYAAKNDQGETQDDDLDDSLNKRRAGYAPDKGLRGRKVYPHHAGLRDDHWKNPLEDRTRKGNVPWQEYRRPQKDGRE